MSVPFTARPATAIRAHMVALIGALALVSCATVPEPETIESMADRTVQPCLRMLEGDGQPASVTDPDCGCVASRILKPNYSEAEAAWVGPPMSREAALTIANTFQSMTNLDDVFFSLETSLSPEDYASISSCAGKGGM